MAKQVEGIKVKINGVATLIPIKQCLNYSVVRGRSCSGGGCFTDKYLTSYISFLWHLLIFLGFSGSSVWTERVELKGETEEVVGDGE